MNEFQRPKLIALVYRAGKGCRQWPFSSTEELDAWSARHPNRNETVKVCAVVHGQITHGTWMPAPKAAEYLRQIGAAAI